MNYLKKCPYCDNALEHKDKNMCPECGFDFAHLKIKCNSCNTYYSMDEKTCPKCMVASRIPFLSARDMFNLLSFLKLRKCFVYSAAFDTLFLFAYLVKVGNGIAGFDVFFIFALSCAKSLLYFYSNIKPHLCFLYAIFVLCALCVASIYACLLSSLFLPASIFYLFFIYKFSKGYDAGLKIKENIEHLKRLF